MAEVTMKFGDLELGFFRYRGRIYFCYPYGDWNLHYPVKDGKIVRQSDGTAIHPDETISVIPKEEMTKYGLLIGAADNPLEKRFWATAP